ncbi:MAG: hypothetical protein HND42_05505 [Armatimonadetes bacterium]|nr:hypothetical protein [Armatimonadota bacterium]NOG92683.1 hypothetical protein [Armatimonadota bacterium]
MNWALVPSLAAALMLPALAEAQFEKDRRLDAVVSVRSNAGTVKSVLESVSKATGVELRVAPPLDDDLVILVCKNRKASDVLKKISDHFDWSWVREGDAYRLIQTKEHADKEKAEFREQIMEPYRRLRESAKQYLKILESTDVEQATREIEHIRALGAAQYERENYDRVTELERRVDPGERIFHEVFASLNDGELEALHRDYRIIVTTNPKRGQFRLRVSPEKLKPFVVAALSRARSLVIAPTDPDNPGAVEFRVPKDEDVTGYRIVVRREFGVTPDDANLRWSFQPESNGEPLQTIAWGSLQRARTADGNSVQPHEQLELGPIAEMRIEREWLVRFLSVDERGQNYLGSAHPRLWRPGEPHVEPLQPLGEYFTEIASHIGIDLIMDCHDRMMRLRRPDSEPRNFGMLLQQAHSRVPLAVEARDGWVSVTPKSRAFMRSENVPRPILFPSIEREFREGGQTIEHGIWLITSLRDEQLLWFGSFFGFGGEYLSALRLLGALGPNARRLVLQGTQISYGSLSPQGKKHYEEILIRSQAAFVPVWDGNPYDEWSAHEAANRDWFGGKHLVGGPTHDLTDVHPNGIPVDAYVSVMNFDRRAVNSRVKERGYTASGAVWTIGRVAMQLFEAGEEASNERFSFAMMNLKDFVLTCRTTSTFARGAILTDQSLASEFGSYRSLPEDFRMSIEEVMKRMRDIGDLRPVR